MSDNLRAVTYRIENGFEVKYKTEIIWTPLGKPNVGDSFTLLSDPPIKNTVVSVELITQYDELKAENKKLRDLLSKIKAFHGFHRKIKYMDIDGSWYDLDPSRLDETLKELDSD